MVKCEILGIPNDWEALLLLSSLHPALHPGPQAPAVGEQYIFDSKQVSPDIFGGQQSHHVEHDTSGEGNSKDTLPSDPVNSTLICVCTNGGLNLDPFWQ